MKKVHQIFLSAVSGEFRLCREMLRSDLTGPDMPCVVAEQSDFAVGGSTLLEKLDRYISESCAVVHLVGEATGAGAKNEEVKSFLAARPQFLSQWPLLRTALGDFLTLSYTQWEAYMALDHGVPLYIYLPSSSFADRQQGFQSNEEERTIQKAHLEQLIQLGLDRGQFASAERLCSMVLRIVSRLMERGEYDQDLNYARRLEGFAKWRDAHEDEDPNAERARATIMPFHFQLALPAHLIAEQSNRVEFHLREPGYTSLEAVAIHFEIGTCQVNAHQDLLCRGGVAKLTADTELLLQESGTPQMRLHVTCERSALRETFSWKEFVHVASRGAELSLGAMKLYPINFELEGEVLRVREGTCGVVLQPVPAAGQRFAMGSPRGERGRQADEEVHPVRFLRSWWMSRHPISQKQFLQVMGRNPAKFIAQSLDFPIESVCWSEANEFCERLTQLEREEDKLPLGFSYRLPTEAEWEFSCRSGEVTPQVSTSSSATTEAAAVSHAISTFPLDGNRGANYYGLCDMTGNVFQWCLDVYAAYPAVVVVDPCATGDAGADRIIRGGSWHDPPAFRRPGARTHCHAQTRSSRIGFRVVLARV